MHPEAVLQRITVSLVWDPKEDLSVCWGADFSRFSLTPFHRHDQSSKVMLTLWWALFHYTILMCNVPDKNIKITLAYMSLDWKKNLANFLMIVQRQHFKYIIFFSDTEQYFNITECSVNIWVKSWWTFF